MGGAPSKMDPPGLHRGSRDPQDGSRAANTNTATQGSADAIAITDDYFPSVGSTFAADSQVTAKLGRAYQPPQLSRSHPPERNKCRTTRGYPATQLEGSAGALCALRLARPEPGAPADAADLTSIGSASPTPSVSSRSSAAQSSSSSALLLSSLSPPVPGEIPNCFRISGESNVCAGNFAASAGANVHAGGNRMERRLNHQSMTLADQSCEGRRTYVEHCRPDGINGARFFDGPFARQSRQKQTQQQQAQPQPLAPVQQVNFARPTAQARQTQLISDSDRAQQLSRRHVRPRRYRYPSVSSLFASQSEVSSPREPNNNNHHQPAFAADGNWCTPISHKQPPADTNSPASDQHSQPQQQQLPTDEAHCRPPADESHRPTEDTGASGPLEASAQTDKSSWNHMDWKGIAHRYGRRPRGSGQHERLWWRVRQSFACHLLLGSIHGLFPIFASFKGYDFPSSLLGDILAGFTIAVLHIPQGMAYGLLAGVEPIYGLYTSFIPVVVMALMSKSRHVSYGTFAIVSMLLANAIDSFKEAATEHQKLMLANSVPEPPEVGLAGLVLADNHQPAQLNLERRQLIRSILTGASSNVNQRLEPLVGSHQIPTTTATISTPTSGSSFGEPEIVGHLWPAELQLSTEFIMPSNIEILTAICLLVGLIQLLMSIARLGVLSLMFSDQLVSSFTAASAIHVVTSQIGALFDLNLPPVPDGLFRVCRVWWVFGDQLLEGFNYYTAILSFISILFLLAVKEFLEPLLRRKLKSLTCLPSELILMSFLIFASWNWQFNTKFNIRIIGNVPTGLPEPQLPRLDFAPMLIQDALTIALLSFAMNLSLAQVYAKRYKYTIDPNQELFAVGTANVVGSFFSCFPCASSLSRSAVQSGLNAKSQISALFSCAIVVSIICYFAPILHDLPKSTLSCIIIVALKGILVQVKDLYENWRLSKLDALVWLTTFMSVIAFGVTYGLVLGMMASLFTVFFRLLTPNHSILGQLPGTDIFVDRDAFTNCNEIEGVRIFRFNSALCYLNRTMFKSSVEESLPSVYKKSGFSLLCSVWQQTSNDDKDKVKFLIIDCSGLAYCDYSGAATLVDIIEDLEEHKLTVYLAACPLKLIHMIEKMQKTAVLERSIYPTIADAIGQARYLRQCLGVSVEQMTPLQPIQPSCLLQGFPS